MRATAEQVSSLHRVAPRCWKLVTSSNFWPLMLISALKLFVLLVMILLFSALITIPCAVALACESFGEVLKFAVAIAQEIDVGKS